MLSQWATPPPPVLSDEGAGRVLTPPLYTVHGAVHDAVHGAMHDLIQCTVRCTPFSAAPQLAATASRGGACSGSGLRHTLGRSNRAAQNLSRVRQPHAHGPNTAGSPASAHTSALAFPSLGTAAADAQQQRTVARLTGSSMASTFDELDQLAALMRKRSALSSQRRLLNPHPKP